MSRRTAPRRARSWKKLGYGPDKPLDVKVSTRNIAHYRDPAVILIDQLKQIYIDGELDTVETANWFPKVTRKDYQIGLNLTGSAVDDPDQQFYENYACGSQRNYTRLLQSRNSTSCSTSNRSRPIRTSARSWSGRSTSSCRRTRRGRSSSTTRAATCWQPYVKNVTLMVNSIYNGWRMEDWWLDKAEKQNG